jgi:glycosyltransferase involved in cell wall biosynthesis
MSLRLLHIDSGRDWRGGQRQVFLLAAGQRARGDEPLVVAQFDAPLVRRLRGSGLAASGLRMRGEWDLVAATRLRRLIRAWRPHLVHAHDARAHTIALAALVGMRTPLVVTRRVAFTPRGRLKYGRPVARFIAISNAVKRAMMDGGVPADRIDVVYSGVPAPAVAQPRPWRRELGWPEEAVLCGVVGAMTAEKGVPLLVHIAAHLSDAARARCRLLLLGGQGSGAVTLGGVPAYRAGFVDQIHAAMAGLDMLWHPARAEGLGTAVIDAMALGVPPVAFAVGGLTELIEPGVSGVLVPPEDVESFAREASRLILATGVRHEMALAGPARAAHFSVERMLDGAEAVYTRVLGNIPAHRARPAPMADPEGH